MTIAKVNGVAWASIAKINGVAVASLAKVNSEAKPASGISCSFLQAAVNASDLTTYTFASQSLGSAAAGRYIIAAVFGRSASSRTISSVTIGGVTATAVVQNSSNSGSNRIGLFIANVPTGDTGDVVVVFSGGMVRAGIALYRATGLNATAEDTDISTADPLTSTLTVSANSIQIAAAYTQYNGASTATWSGVTEDYDTAMESGAYEISGGSKISASAGSVTPQCTWTQSAFPIYVAASFPAA